MPSSLNAGPRPKKWRIQKVFEILNGATQHVRSGGFININSGGQLTKATGARVLFTDQANPGTCTKGELNVDAAGKLNVCSATNTWTIVGTQS